MIRQQRRSELREMTKELKKFEKTDLYKAMVKYFERLPKDQYELLEKGTHENPVKQNEFNGFMRLMKGYIEIQTRIEYLQSLAPVGKENTALAQ